MQLSSIGNCNMNKTNKATHKKNSTENITQSTVHQFLGKEQEKQLELALGNNLYLFVTKIGSCIFKYRYNYNGKLSWMTLGQYMGKDKLNRILGLSLDEARIKAIEFNLKIRDGVNLKEEIEREKSKGITIIELANKYFSEQLSLKRPNLNSQKQFIRAVNTDILQTIGNYPVANVDDDLIREKVIQPKIKGGSPASARRAKINIKLLLDYAIEELKIIKYNPATLIKSERIYKDRPREHYLTLEQLGSLLNIVYSAPIRTQHKIALHLIAILLPRKMELLAAKWSQVDFQNKTFTIMSTKTGNNLLVKLPEQAIKLFEIQKELSANSEFIFPSRNSLTKPISHNTLNYILRPLLQNRINDFVVHDLRRTGATILGEFGYPVEIIEASLNHTKFGIQKVYHRSQYLEQRQRMLQDYADKIDKLIMPELLPYDKYFAI